MGKTQVIWLDSKGSRTTAEVTTDIMKYYSPAYTGGILDNLLTLLGSLPVCSCSTSRLGTAWLLLSVSNLRDQVSCKLGIYETWRQGVSKPEGPGIL